MPVVVSDTSAIRCLDHLDRLDLLPSLFREVVIPPAVSDELSRPRPRFRPVVIASISYIRVQRAADANAVAQLQTDLGPGEAEAIVLATELSAELLIDEATGRAEARR